MCESPASQLWRGVAYDHAQQRHDARRHLAEDISVAQQIAHHQSMVDWHAAEIVRQDWQLMPDPERTRARYHEAIAHHMREIAGLETPVMLAPFSVEGCRVVQYK